MWEEGKDESKHKIKNLKVKKLEKEMTKVIINGEEWKVLDDIDYHEYNGVKVSDIALGEQEELDMIIEDGLEISDNIRSLRNIAPGRRCYPKLSEVDNQVELLK